MARGINKVILIGNCGQDPETRFTKDGKAVTNISIATSESWKDKTTGEQQERTEWHRLVFFNRLGEIAGEYLKKGSKVYVEGSLRTRQWQNKEGVDQYTTEIVANEMQMLDSRDGASGSGGRTPAASQGVAQPSPSAQHASGNSNQPNPTYQQAGGDDWDDDIPY